MPTDPFDFGDPAPVEREVLWKGRKYLLKEPSEGAWAAYQGVLDANRRYDEHGKFNGLAAGYTGADAVLVAGCLFLQDRDKGLLPVPLQEIRDSWPHKVVDPMVEWLKEVGSVPAPTPKPSAAGPSTSDSPSS